MPVTLTQVHSMPSLVRSYKWDINFPQVPPMLASEFGVYNFSENFNIRCISTAVPKANMEMVSAAPRGIDLDEPGLVHLNGDITFTLVDTVDLLTRKILYGLRQICMRDINKEQQDLNSFAASYAGSGTDTGIAKGETKLSYKDQSLAMLMKRLDNHNRVIWCYYCGKCFLKDYTDPDFDGQSSAVQPTMTIHYNYFVDGTYTEINKKLNKFTAGTKATETTEATADVFGISDSSYSNSDWISSARKTT